MGFEAASPTRQPAAGFLTTHLSRRVRIFAAAASPAALPFCRTGRFRCSRVSRPPRHTAGRSPRPPHPPRQHPRDEWRELQAQPEPQASNPDGELNRPPNPRLTPWAHRSLPRAPPRRPVEGTPRRTRGPPMDYGDKPAAAKRSLLTPPRSSLFAPPLTHGRVSSGRLGRCCAKQPWDV